MTAQYKLPEPQHVDERVTATWRVQMTNLKSVVVQKVKGHGYTHMEFGGRDISLKNEDARRVGLNLIAASEWGEDEEPEQESNEDEPRLNYLLYPEEVEVASKRLVAQRVSFEVDCSDDRFIVVTVPHEVRDLMDEILDARFDRDSGDIPTTGQ